MTTIEATTSIVTDTWKLLIIGGTFHLFDHGSNDVEKVDPNKKSSNCDKPMAYPISINGHTAQAFPDQYVLSCGGVVSNFTHLQNVKSEAPGLAASI